MKVIDPGHDYLLLQLDGIDDYQWLTFVKRVGPKFPGNTTAYAGTTMQEVLRAVIDRAKYVNNQIPCAETAKVIALCTDAIYQLELRAAARQDRPFDFDAEEAVHGETCKRCGHIHCAGHAEGRKL